MLKYIVNLLIFLLVYLVPLGIFIQYTKQYKRNFTKILFSIVYIILCLYTSDFVLNLLPFILVILTIRAIKVQGDHLESDYHRYQFNIKTLNVIRGLQYAGASYGITFLMAMLSMFIFSFFNVELKQQEVITEMANASLWNFILVIPPVVIFAPVVEEFVFRWLIFEKIFANRVGVYVGAVLSSIIFAFVHFNVKAFPMILTIGLINCYLIHKKGYWYAVLNHLVFNFMTTFFLFLQKIAL